ncbi:hypothetical protein AAGT82_20060 [Enterobacter quasihormaechei]|uniref:GGDEF domain-containing protein n=1 Tax=Enterobacter quasihormaechei TaxID=2529382 RepID=A0ABU9PNA9_9ENTR
MTNDSMLDVVKLTSQRNVHWGQAPPESADEPRMAEVCQGQRDTSAILMRADKALYDARRTGRGKSILASDYL